MTNETKYWKVIFVSDNATLLVIDRDSGKLTLVISREKRFATQAEAEAAVKAKQDSDPQIAAMKVQVKEFDPVEHEQRVRESHAAIRAAQPPESEDDHDQ